MRLLDNFSTQIILNNFQEGKTDTSIYENKMMSEDNRYSNEQSEVEFSFDIEFGNVPFSSQQEMHVVARVKAPGLHISQSDNEEQVVVSIIRCVLTYFCSLLLGAKCCRTISLGFHW